MVPQTPVSAGAPVFLIGTSDGGVGADEDRYTRAGSTLELYLWGTVRPTDPDAKPDLDGNLMKYREVDTQGRVTALRDDVAFASQPAVMTLAKSANATAIQTGQTVTYTIPIANASTTPTTGGPAPLPFDAEDIRVWDALPLGIDCADVTIPTGPYVATCGPGIGLVGVSGAAAAPGVDVIQWVIPGPIAPGAGLNLTVSLVVPSGLGVALDFVNTASIVSFNSPNTGGTDTPYYPVSTIFTPPTPALDNTPAAEATATVRTGDLAIVKTVVPTDPWTANGGQNPGFTTATDVVRGQRITYTYTTTIPAGSAIFQGVLSDVLPAGIIIDAGSTVTATFPGGSLSAGGSLPSGWDADVPDVLHEPVGDGAGRRHRHGGERPGARDVPVRRRDEHQHRHHRIPVVADRRRSQDADGDRNRHRQESGRHGRQNGVP